VAPELRATHALVCLNGAPLNWATAGTRDMRRFVTRPVIVLKGPGPWPRDRRSSPPA
jgi:hypothetical protein